MEDFENTFENVSIELRRGLTNMVVLSQSTRHVSGYALVKSLGEQGFPIEANTVYPLLRRLEKQGLLSSDWDTSTDKTRKYYQISPEGLRFYDRLRAQWYENNKTVQEIIEE